MARKWVVNASPLILLGKISRIPLLAALAQEVIVPEGVTKEIDRGPDGDPSKIWLANDGRRWRRPFLSIDPLVAAWDLGMGGKRSDFLVSSSPGP